MNQNITEPNNIKILTQQKQGQTSLFPLTGSSDI